MNYIFIGNAFKRTIMHKTGIYMEIGSRPKKWRAVFKDSVYMEGLKNLEGRDSLELIHDISILLLGGARIDI